MLFLFNFAIFSKKKKILKLQGSWQERTSSNATGPKREVNNTRLDSNKFYFIPRGAKGSSCQEIVTG